MSEPSVSDAQLVALFDGGLHASDIARRVGLTRERVRQRLSRNGRAGTNPHRLPKEPALRAAAKLSTTWRALAERLQISQLLLDRAIESYKIRKEIDALLRSNRNAASAERRLLAQRPYVIQIRQIAAQVGHTPTQAELEEYGLYHASLHEFFGSAQAAMIAAGLSPNVRGRPPLALPEGFSNDSTPTDDLDLLRVRADQLRRSGMSAAPVGNEMPKKVESSHSAYVRDPAVVAWVLDLAAGFCELCDEEGYELDNGVRFLEVHHMRALCENGPDVVSNAVGVCETCHGKLHRAKDRAALSSELYRRLPRLVAITT
jgi:5-methylcytosine-specific restriction enzyme A